VVEFDYVAELNDELTLRVGDVITCTSRPEGGWWKGILRGREGVFPDNFVKVLPSAPVPSSPFKQGEEVLLRKKKRCRVLFSYQPVHDDELELKVDQNLDFMCEVEDGWWKGRLGGRVGVFPSNFVEMCEDDPPDPIKARTETIEELPLSSKALDQMPQSLSLEERSVAAVVEAKNKKNSLGANRFIKEGADAASKALPKVEKEKLETEKAAPSKVMTTSERLLVGGSKTPPDTAPRLPPKPVKEQCLVLFPYTAQNEDELTLEEGQTILIISREVEDKGWWKGEVDGRTGVFPDNFVKLIVEEEKRERKPSRPPPVAQEVEKSLLGKVVTNSKPQENSLKPLGNSVKRLSDDIKAALSSENLSRSPGSSEKLRGSEERLVSRFDRRSSEKRKSRRSGEERSGSGERLSSTTTTTTSIGGGARKTSTHSKTSSTTSAMSKLIQSASNSTSSQSKLSSMSTTSKASPAPSVPLVAHKVETTDTSRLEATDRRLSEPPTKRLDTSGHEASGLVDLSQSAPLSHPTAGRVKAPKRRPPSQHFLKENIPDLEIMEPSPDSSETSIPVSKSKPAVVESGGGVSSQVGGVSSQVGGVSSSQKPRAAQVLPTSAQDSSPGSEAKPSWLEELSRKQANRRSGVFPEKQQPPPSSKPVDQEQQQPFRRSGGGNVAQEEVGRPRSLVGAPGVGVGHPEKPVASSKPEPPLAENKPNLPSRPSQVKAEEGNRKSLSSSLASSASSFINSKKAREQENTKPTDSTKSDKAPGRPTLPAALSKAPSAPSIPSPSASVGSKKELGRRESERESEEKKRRTTVGDKHEEENVKVKKGSDPQLSRNPSDSSSSKNSSNSSSVHSTNLGKPAQNLSFVGRPEKPTVAASDEKVKGLNNKEEERKTSEVGLGVGGSSIGWNADVLRGRASGAERTESTNTEYTNGTESNTSQEVADLKASVISMQADFNLQLNALRRELEEERMARTRLEQEVRSLKKLTSK